MTKEHFEFYGGLFAAITTIGSFIFYFMRNKNAFYSSFKGKIRIQRRQDMLFSKYSNIKRVLTIQASNGGGMPRKGGSIKISVRFESCNLNEESGLIDDWQDVEMDSEYYSILSRMIESSINETSDPYYEVFTDDLNRKGYLRTTLQAQKVSCFRVYYVGQIWWKWLWMIPVFPKKMIYVGVNYTAEQKEDPDHESDCMAYVEFLRHEFS